MRLHSARSLVLGSLLSLTLPLSRGAAQTTPASWARAGTRGDFVIRDFVFASGERLPELRLHYTTLGKPQRDAQGIVRNAVMILHGTGGAGGSFLSNGYAGELFAPGKLLDSAKYFVILPDGIGHGGSSKPSDGLRTRFPKYTYDDMVVAQHRLLTEHLGVNHLRLIMGTSMGCMHAWVGVGLHVPTIHGRLGTVCLRARTDRRAKSDDSDHGHGCHSQRSRVEEW